MIGNSFNAFSEDTHYIFHHLDLSRKQEELAKAIGHKSPEDKTEKEKQFITGYYNLRTPEKQMNYGSNVIFLYGIFEQFVESSIREYIEEICSFMTEYKEHDDVIKKKYFELWISIQSKLDWEKFSNLSKEMMVNNLYETVHEGKPNVLYQCFLKNGGNYNHDRVSDAIYGITGKNFKETLSKYNPLKRYYDKNYMKSNNADILFARLNDFVKSRNDIAHNGRPAEMMSDDEFRKTTHFLLSYSESMTRFLNDNYLRKMWEVKCHRDNIPIHKPVKYFSRLKTASFDIENAIIFKNQEVVVKQPEDCYPQFVITKISEVHQKQNDGSIKEVDEIASVVRTEFSLKLTDKVSPKSEFIFI